MKSIITFVNNDKGALLKIVEDSVELAPYQLIFDFQAVAGRSYSVQCAESLSGPWVSVEHILPPAVDGLITVTNPVSFDGLEKFYRMVTPLSQ